MASRELRGRAAPVGGPVLRFIQRIGCVWFLSSSSLKLDRCVCRHTAKSPTWTETLASVLFPALNVGGERFGDELSAGGLIEGKEAESFYALNVKHSVFLIFKTGLLLFFGWLLKCILQEMFFIFAVSVEILFWKSSFVIGVLPFSLVQTAE